MDFTGKGVLITGSGQGIGSDMALRFAEAGADVAVHYRSSADGASEVVSRIESMGRKAVALRADVTIEEDVRILVEAARDGLGRLDVLINNAGSYPVSTIVEMSVEEWRSVIDSNLQSALSLHCRPWRGSGSTAKLVAPS